MDGNIKTIQVLFIAAEAEPFIKVGGLGDVAGALPKTIRKLSERSSGDYGIDIRLVIPYHADIKKRSFAIEKIGEFQVDSILGQVPCEVYYSNQNGLPVYLLDSLAINNNSPVYHADPLLDGMKYIFFSKACLELTKHLKWTIDILHANDWHTSSAIYALKTTYKRDPFFKDTKTILSLHNLPFTGFGTQDALTKYALPPGNAPTLPDWAKHSPLPLGLLTADRIIAVSPNYAKEILTPEFGCGLESFLQTRSSKIMGILNGIDTDIWNPMQDKEIIFNYDFDTLTSKNKNKTALQAAFNLENSQEIPLLTLISRMDPQKGVDIAIRGLQTCIDESWQAIILGTGNPVIEQMANDLANEHPAHIKTVTKFDAHLAHQLYAGSDIFLMPSRYEPCGISQMISMNYGTIPVARATGGLADTINNYKSNRVDSTGFLFTKPYPSTFKYSLQRALKLFHQKEIWLRLQLNGMRQDFSWNKSAASYTQVYKSLIN